MMKTNVHNRLASITAISDTATGAGDYGSHAYSYDDLHQLSGATIILGTTYRDTFTYNAAGNRATASHNGGSSQTYNYTSNTNQLATITGGRAVSFSYNDLGALTSMTETLSGLTILAGATYIPSGLLYAKADLSQDGATVDHGNTVSFEIMPNGEMLAKYNWSTELAKFFAYDLSGNLLEEGAPTDETNPSSNEPIIDHIYLGGHRLATITSKGNVCIIATVAFGSPLADELYVFRAFRDRVLMRLSPGKAFVEWYYQDFGPRGAEWLKVHAGPRFGARVILTVLAIPLKAMMFGGWPLLLTLCLCVSVVIIFSFRRHWTWRRATVASLGLAFGLAIIYAYFIEVPKAMADYTELAKYYYTEDHIGRPFSLRDSNLTLRWYENHYAFGEIINEATANGAMYAGGSFYQISWKPSFRFPGQYEDTDQGIAYNNTSFLVQNHYREYMPQVGRYNRIDPYSIEPSTCSANPIFYSYSSNSPINNADPEGLYTISPNCNYDNAKATLEAGIQDALNKLNDSDNCKCFGDLMKIRPFTLEDLRRAINSSDYACTRSNNVYGQSHSCMVQNFRRFADPPVLVTPCAINHINCDPYQQCGCIMANIIHEAIHKIGIRPANGVSEYAVKVSIANCMPCHR